MHHPLLHAPPFLTCRKINKMINYPIFLFASMKWFFCRRSFWWVVSEALLCSSVAALCLVVFYLWYAHGGGEPEQQNLPSHPPSSSGRMCLMAGPSQSFSSQRPPKHHRPSSDRFAPMWKDFSSLCRVITHMRVYSLSSVTTSTVRCNCFSFFMKLLKNPMWCLDLILSISALKQYKQWQYYFNLCTVKIMSMNTFLQRPPI